MSNSLETRYYDWVANFFRQLFNMSTKFVMGKEVFLEKIKQLRQAIDDRKILFVFKRDDVGYIIKDKKLLEDQLFYRVLTELLFVLRLHFIEKYGEDIIFAQYKLLVSLLYLDTLPDESLKERFRAIEEIIRSLKLDEKYVFHTEIPFDKLIDIEINGISIKETAIDTYALTMYSIDQNGTYKKQTFLLSKEDLTYISRILNRYSVSG